MKQVVFTTLFWATLFFGVDAPVLAGNMSSGFTYPTGATWTNNGNWLAAGCSEYQCSKYHLGRDIGASYNDVVYSMAPGRVKLNSTSTSDVEQKYMWIEYDLDDNVSHFYAVYGHVNSNLAQNAEVAQGVEVARIASWPDNDHLHLGIRPSGILTSGWGRGTIPTGWDGDKGTLPTNGFVAPWDYLSTHHPKGWSTPCNADPINLYVQFGASSDCGSSGDPMGSILSAISKAGNGGTININNGGRVSDPLNPVNKTVTLRPTGGAITLEP